MYEAMLRLSRDDTLFENAFTFLANDAPSYRPCAAMASFGAVSSKGPIMQDIFLALSKVQGASRRLEKEPAQPLADIDLLPGSSRWHSCGPLCVSRS